MLYSLGVGVPPTWPPMPLHPLPPSMTVPLHPISVSLAMPAAVLLSGSQTRMMAVTHQGLAACIPLSLVLFPGIVAAAATELDPEIPGWPAAASSGTSRPLDPLPSRV